MKYLEFKPIDPLANDIQLIWMLESETADDFYPKERIMPDGIVEIVFHYREPFITYSQNGVRFIQPKGFAVSQMRRFIEIESNGSTGFISVRFYPWGAYHFFSKPIKTFLDDTVSLTEIWPEHYQQIMAEICSAESPNERLHAVQQFLLNRLRENKNNRSRIDAAVKLIRASKGQLSIEEVCEETGLSKKQLERNFLATVGTTPKVFSRISRFLNICQNLRDNRGKTLTQLAYECDYFDQAHFIKEFKEFSGFTPKAFFARNNISFTGLS